MSRVPVSAEENWQQYIPLCAALQIRALASLSHTHMLHFAVDFTKKNSHKKLCSSPKENSVFQRLLRSSTEIRTGSVP